MNYRTYISAIVVGFSLGALLVGKPLGRHREKEAAKAAGVGGWYLDNNDNKQWAYYTNSTLLK